MASFLGKILLGVIFALNGLQAASGQSLPTPPTMNETDSNPADLPTVDLGYEIHRAIYYNASETRSKLVVPRLLTKSIGDR